MQSLKFFKLKPVFIWSYGFVFFVALLFLIEVGQRQSFLWLNSFHIPWLDVFFIYYTNLGDGLFAFLFALILYIYCKQRKLAFDLLISFLLSGLVAQILKFSFPHARPQLYFSPQHLSFFIDDIILSGNHSFPSGHTASAFAVAAVLACYTRVQTWHIVYLMLATGVAYSRIYLSQHFLGDVLVGSLIGVLSGFLSVHFTRNISHQQLTIKRKSTTHP